MSQVIRYQKMPPCPVCKTNKQVKVIGVSGDMFRCGRCNGIFDSEPNEGSDVFADPSRRMEKQEERQQQRKRR